MSDDATWRAAIDRFQALYLDGTIEFVSLVNADARACPACLAVGDRGYLPHALPRLPYEGCTAPGGCRCRYEASVTVVE